MRDTLVHDGAGDGVVFSGGGAGRLDGATVCGNGGFGVAVLAGAAGDGGPGPTVSGCRIHSGRGGGVRVEGGAAGRFAGNDIFGHRWRGGAQSA